MSEDIKLNNGVIKAIISPSAGAGVRSFSVRKGEQWLPIMPDSAADPCDLGMSSFIMAPYSNRVENGRFVFANKEYQLENGDNHAIHGDVRNRQWRIEQQDDNYLRCELDTRQEQAVNWPWNFEIRAEYEIMGNVFSSRLKLWNRSDNAMPAGFGWHPYFSRHLTIEDEPVFLQMKYDSIYPDNNDNRMPSGTANNPSPEMDFSNKKAVAPGQFFDCCCRGYDGNGFIEWPESEVTIKFDCTPNLSHLVMYNPTGSPYFAVEPVTNANNGFNLYNSGDDGCGVAVLKPGESLEARFDLIVIL